MKIELLRAWPQRFERVEVDLPEGGCVRDALTVAGWGDDPGTVAYAVFGVKVGAETVLQAGDRLELLRPLVIDPKDARRRRAQARNPK